MAEKVTIYIDNKAYLVDKDNNLLANVLSHQLNLPYFCWHPSMGSVGACRQCAVTQFQDENDDRGRIVMSCMTPVSDGMRIGLQDHLSEQFREQVIGAMMTNHPHDCPVCAEGGECHLQDMTVMTGHTARQYEGSKRTFSNQHLGEFVGHEMNRCITCYRCVRFYKDYAGGEDFGAFGSKNQVYFGRQCDGQLESEFSGNLVEVCPTGVFTNKIFSSHYTRKWDLQSSPSICSHCSVGCNISVGERYGSVRRVMNRYSHDINGYFLCDKGRFGIGYVNSLNRVTHLTGINQDAEISTDSGLHSVDVAKAVSHYRLKNFLGIGSSRASIEANAYLKYIVGEQSFCTGLDNNQSQLAEENVKALQHYKSPSLTEMESCDFILIIGEDITQSSPRVALSIRQALRNASIEKANAIGIPSWQDSAVRTCGGSQLSPLYSINNQETKLDKVCKSVVNVPFNEILDWIEKLNVTIRAVEKPDTDQAFMKNLQQGTVISALVEDFVNAKHPMLITGWSNQSPELLQAVNELAEALSLTKKHQALPFYYAVLPPDANTVGMFSLMDEHTLSVESLIKALASDDVDGVVMLENEMSRLSIGTQVNLREALEEKDLELIVIDHSKHQWHELASLVLPSAAVTEYQGSYVNYQGLVQEFQASHVPSLPILSSWRWLAYFDSVLNAKNASQYISGKHAPETLHELRAGLSLHFEHIPFDLTQYSQVQFARETRRVSGRTAKTANQSVHEPKTATSSDPKFRYSMEGIIGSQSDTKPFVWAPGWNSNQAIHKYISSPNENAFSNAYIQFSSVVLNNEEWKKESVVDENCSEFFDIAVKAPWYKNEWQAKQNPEFEMMHKVNKMYCLQPFALAQGWEDRQVMKLALPEQDVWVQLSVSKRRARGKGTDYLTEMPLILDVSEPFNSSALQIPASVISIATDEEAKAFLEKNQRRLQEAKVNKDKILSSLQKRDQLIPIRLVEGGLDEY